MKYISLDKVFFDIADDFIQLANKHIETVGNEKDRAILSYSSARFNASLVGTNAEILDELGALRDEAKEHFLPIYELKFIRIVIIMKSIMTSISMINLTHNNKPYCL